MAVEIPTIEDLDEIKTMIRALSKEFKEVRNSIDNNRKQEMPEWMTVKQVAKYVSAKPDTIRGRVRTGKHTYRTRRDGNRILIHRASVHQSSRAAKS